VADYLWRLDNMKKNRAKYNVSARAFLEVWQTANNADEVAERLKMPKPIVLARAANYRKAGINLKKLSRSTKNRLNVEDLNELIEELGRGDENVS
jgi:hypothetical protein